MKEKIKIRNEIKDLWWRGFAVLTFISFWVAIFRKGDEWYQMFFAWLIVQIIWIIILGYFYNKDLKEINKINDREN